MAAARPTPRGSALQLPWIEKYRPNTLAELIAHSHILETRACARVRPRMCVSDWCVRAFLSGVCARVRVRARVRVQSRR